MSIIVTSPADAGVHSSWQVPVFESPPDQILGWLEEQIQEGEGCLTGQKAFQNLDRNRRIFDGVFEDKVQSTLRTNTLRYLLRKFVETISDIREISLYGSDAPQFKIYADPLNRVANSVYRADQYPRQLRKALQYAAVEGRGYLWPKCKTEDYGWGPRKIVFEPKGLLEVVPVQVPSSNRVQDAYSVTIYEYMPIAEAHGRFPLFQSELKPVDQGRFNSRFGAKRVDRAERNSYGQDIRNWGNLYCEIRYTFIRDLRINDTGYELPMGDENTSWFIKVPYIGQQILGGIRDGAPFMRPAEKEDCRVYPTLRLIITSSTVSTPMYDGPAWDWHGKIPLAQYEVDDTPWDQIGQSLVENVASIEQTKRKHERLMDQTITTTLDPPLGYDRTATGGPKIEHFNMFDRGVRMGVDGRPQEVMQSILPEEVRVTDVHFKYLEILTQAEEGQLGINDIGSLMDMKLNLSGDSMDKVLDPIGPIAKGIAVAVEAGNSDVGYMLKFMIPQWYDTRRVIEIIGPNNLPDGIFDYDPDSIIPSHAEEEYTKNLVPSADAMGEVEVQWAHPMTPSAYSQLERAKRFAKNMRLLAVPSTLLKLTQVQEQTKYMSLYGRGAPISFHTVAKKLNIENYGEIAGDTEFEKWKNEQILMLVLKGQAAQLAGQLGLGELPEPQGKQHPGGRPPSDKEPPKRVMKGKNIEARPVTKTAR